MIKYRRRQQEVSKNKNDKSSRRKSKSIIISSSRGGISSYTPSRLLLSRRFSKSSRGDDIIADDDISSCCKTAEDSSTGGYPYDVISSTKIHIQQEDAIPLHHIDENKETNDDGICDDILSKLIDLLPCLPQTQHTNDISEKIQPKIPETYNNDDETMTQIECILRQAMDDDKEEDELSVPFSTNEDHINDDHTSYNNEDTTNKYDEDRLSVPFPINENDINDDHTSYNSEDTTDKLPPPKGWIQNLLLVSTPQSNMRINCIRRISEPSYFDCPSDVSLDNNQVIELPINSGKEVDSWVIDFETTVFAGTALFRIRGCDERKSSSTESNDTTHDYFERYNRRFQLIVRGKFKERVVIADCMSGLLLDHPLNSSATASNMDCSDGIAWHGESETNSSVIEPPTSDKQKRVSKRRLKKGKSKTNDSSNLPPKWILRAAVKVAGVFSPRIDVDLECSHPRILTPLCSTAQTIIRHDNGLSPRLDGLHEEPCIDSNTSLVVDLCGLSPNKQSNNASNDVQSRKRYSDAVYDKRVEYIADCSGHQTSSTSPCFDTDAEYTFEFLQHLVDYNDLSLDLGRVVGKVKLGAVLRGQPVRFISAAVKQRGSSESKELTLKDVDCLWSFDLWHKSLLP